MNRYIYLLIIGFCALAGWAGAYVTVTRLAPFGVKPDLAITSFYLSVGIALAASFTLVNYLLRFGGTASLLVLMRQGVLLSLLILAFLFLQHIQVLTWWDGVLLVGIAILIEFLFAVRDERAALPD